MIRKSLHRLREFFLNPLKTQLDQQDVLIRVLSDAQFIARAALKKYTHQPINILFVCHEPSLWGMFETVYGAMAEDQEFHPLVVTLPYMHSSIQTAQYMDAGMFEFCESKKIKAVQGYDKEKNIWHDPASFMPDYVFFQTPYNILPSGWSADKISLISRICYLPYGATLFKGEVESIVYPQSFMRYAHLIFKENTISREIFLNKFQNSDWFDEKKIILSGSTKLDKLTAGTHSCGVVWKRGLQHDIKRILWTPRWTTSEGICHFFDYKDFFFEFCEKHQDIDFIFRPHPLCFKNFLQTGQLKENDVINLRIEYDNSPNMILDKSNEYYDTFLSSDILISDLSSMMVEFFVTEKPIVYTHRIDLFNELGRKLSEGFYWVNNATELEKTLKMLISGVDPLKEKRKELIKKVMYIPEEGSGTKIKKIIGLDFKTAVYTFQ